MQIFPGKLNLSFIHKKRTIPIKYHGIDWGNSTLYAYLLSHPPGEKRSSFTGVFKSIAAVFKRDSKMKGNVVNSSHSYQTYSQRIYEYL